MTRRCFAPDRARRVRRPAALAPAAPASLLAVAALAAVIFSGCDGGTPAPPPNPDRPQHLPTATITVGDTALSVEVADSEAERNKGMMFRERLAENEAMLFVFDREANPGFWMKNTPVDLDIAYIAADGAITQIERLTAYNVEPVFSRQPARFALEAPAGWFGRRGIAVGTKVTIPAAVARAAKP